MAVSRSFLGLTGYYKDYGSIGKPLNELTEKTTAFESTKSKEWSIWEVESGSHNITNFGISFCRSKGWIHIRHRCTKLPHWSCVVIESRWGRKSDHLMQQSVISTGTELLCHQKRTLDRSFFKSTFQALPSGTAFPVEDRLWSITGYSVLNSQKNTLLECWRHWVNLTSTSPTDQKNTQ